MKFKLVAYTEYESSFNINIGEYHIQSLCGRHRKIIGSYDYNKNIRGNILSLHNECVLTRVVRRLNKIGIDIELSCNFPWVYLDSVNSVKITEKKNASHGYCITYNTDRRNLRFRKDLFKKIREEL